MRVFLSLAYTMLLDMSFVVPHYPLLPPTLITPLPLVTPLCRISPIRLFIFPFLFLSDVNDLRPCSSTETESTGTSGQRSTPIRPSGPRTDVLTSTPNMSSAGDTPSVQSPVQPICEGMFVGRARHKDGSSLSLLFQVL